MVKCDAGVITTKSPHSQIKAFRKSKSGVSTLDLRDIG